MKFYILSIELLGYFLMLNSFILLLFFSDEKIVSGGFAKSRLLVWIFIILVS